MKEKIYIFGAHSRAQTLGHYLVYLYPNIEIEAFLIDNEEENPEDVQGVPVVRLEKSVMLNTEYPVYLATRGIYHALLMDKLKQLGMKQVIPVTVELDLKLRNAYLEKYYNAIGQEFIKIDNLKGKKNVSLPYEEHLKAAIYVTRSSFDKPLKQDYKLAAYEKEIHAGAELGDGYLKQNVLADNIGDNISSKNRQYCELTVLYWIWRHSQEDIVGLAHYRRHFILPDDWVERMESHGIDVILPVPLYVAPDLEGNYKSRHADIDWECMMRALRTASEQDYKDAMAFFKGNLYSPCNMFIARREVMEEYCAWLFPILNTVTECIGYKNDSYLNRYPGFLAERLLTFFFAKNRKRYRIIYADKNFLT